VDRLSVEAISYIEVGDMLKDKGEKLDIGVDSCAVNRRTKVGCVGLLEHGRLLKLNFALLLAEALEMIFGVPVNCRIIFILEHLFKKVRSQNLIASTD
jgi:hypothetical protein